MFGVNILNVRGEHFKVQVEHFTVLLLVRKNLLLEARKVLDSVSIQRPSASSYFLLIKKSYCLFEKSYCLRQERSGIVLLFKDPLLKNL